MFIEHILYSEYFTDAGETVWNKTDHNVAFVELAFYPQVLSFNHQTKKYTSHEES